MRKVMDVAKASFQCLYYSMYLEGWKYLGACLGGLAIETRYELQRVKRCFT